MIIWICVSVLFQGRQGVAAGRRRARRRSLLVAVVCIIARHARTNDGVACYFFSEVEHGSYFVVGGSGSMCWVALIPGFFFFSGPDRESVLLLPLAPRVSLLQASFSTDSHRCSRHLIGGTMALVH